MKPPAMTDAVIRGLGAALDACAEICEDPDMYDKYQLGHGEDYQAASKWWSDMLGYMMAPDPNPKNV